MTRVILLQSNAPSVNYTPPLGLGYLAASLEKNNHEVKIIDASAPYASYTANQLIQEVKNYAPDLVGVTITIPWAVYSYQLMRELQRHVDVPIVAGGPHPTQLPG